MSSQAGGHRLTVPSGDEQPVPQQSVQQRVDGRVVTTSVQPLPDHGQLDVPQTQQQRLQQHLRQQQRQQQGVQQAQQQRLHQLRALHQQGRLSPAGVQLLAVQQQQETAGSRAASQQQQQQQQEVRHAGEERRPARLASAAVPAAAAPVAMASAVPAGPLSSTNSMEIMTSLYAQLAAANPVPQGMPIATPLQLREHMERLRNMRAEVLQRTVRTQKQLEQDYLARKLALQDGLQRSLTELDHESRQAEKQLEWHANNGAIALMASGGAAAAAAVAEVASRPHLAPMAAATVTEANSRPRPAPSVITRPAAPPAAAAEAQPAAAPAAASEPAAEPQSAEALTAASEPAGEDLVSEQLVSTPFYAPHLAAVGLAHIASATPPLVAAADVSVAEATPAAGAPAPLAAVPASDDAAATAAAEAAAEAAFAAAAEAAFAAAMASSERAAMQQPVLADPAVVQSPGAPPKPPAMAKRQRSGPVVRQLSMQHTKPSLPQQATPEASAPTGAAAPHAAAGLSSDAKQPATESVAKASRNKRMDLLASAAVSQSSPAQQQSPQPTHSAAISPAGAAAALLSLQPETEEADARAPAAPHEQPVAVPAAAGGTPPAGAKAAGAADGRAGASTASADPAAEAGARAARSPQPDVIDLAGTSDTDSPAAGGASFTGHDADSGATYADARSSGSWRVGDGDGDSGQLEDVPQPAGKARSSKHCSRGRNNRKRKAADGSGAGTLQHAGGGVLRQSNSGAQQPRMAAQSAEAAADSQQPAAANWTSVKSFWHVPLGKTKPVKVMSANALAQETHNQAVAADFVQLADARQQLAVEHDSLEGAAGDARQDDAAVRPLAAKATLPRRSSRRKAGGRSMVPDAAGGATAGGSSVHSGSKRSGSQAAGAQLDDDGGFTPRKRVRRAPAKLLEAPAAAAAAAQPRRQPASGDQPQGVTRQSSQEPLPDAAAAAHSQLQGAASGISPGAEGPSPPRNQRAAAAQAAAVTQAMLQLLRPAAKPAAKGDTKPGKTRAASGRGQASKPAAAGAAAQPPTPAAAAAPAAEQGAAATANGAAGRDPAAMGSKPGDSFHVFQLPRVRPKASARWFPAAIFTAAGLKPPQASTGDSAAEAPGRSAAAGGATADSAAVARPPQRMFANLPDMGWQLNRPYIIRRAWNDSANVSRQIPKSWDEALAHPTLRSLALRSSRRYSVRSIVGLRGGAGSAWLLHTLFEQFGVESKVADVQQAAPKRHWRPASSASRTASKQQPQQQPQKQPEQQPQQPAQEQQPGQHPGSGPLHGSEPHTPEQSGSERGPQESGGAAVEPAAEEASLAPDGPCSASAANAAAAAAAAAAPDATGTPPGAMPPSPPDASGAPAAAATADVEPAAAEIAVAGAAGDAAERGQPLVQQAAALEAALPASAAGELVADDPAASVQHQLQPAELAPDNMAALPDAAGTGAVLNQQEPPPNPPLADVVMVDAPAATPSEQQQQQQPHAAPAEAAALDAMEDISGLQLASEQPPPTSFVGMPPLRTGAEPDSLQGLGTTDDAAAAAATAEMLAAAVAAVTEAVHPPDAAAVSTSSAPAVQQDLPPDSAAAAGQQLPGGDAAAPLTVGTQQQPIEDVTAEPAAGPKLQPGLTAGSAAEPAQREEPNADVQPALDSTPQCSGAEQLPIADLIEQLLPPAAARGSSAESDQGTGAPADASAELISGGDEASVAVQSQQLVKVQQSKALIPHVPQLF